MGFGQFKKIKQGSAKAMGGIGKALNILGGLGEAHSALTSFIESQRPPKPTWGGPSETGDSFTRLMQKRFGDGGSDNKELTKDLLSMLNRGEIDAKEYEQLYNQYRKR
jgi:hypothetical protein